VQFRFSLWECAVFQAHCSLKYSHGYLAAEGAGCEN